MIEWAEHNFSLNTPNEGGITKREHLEQVEKQMGHGLEELEAGVDFPELLANVWSAFCDLSNSRSQGFSGPNPISYTEIKDWSDLTNTPISAKEVKLIKELDKVYMRVTNG